MHECRRLKHGVGGKSFAGPPFPFIVDPTTIVLLLNDPSLEMGSNDNK